MNSCQWTGCPNRATHVQSDLRDDRAGNEPVYCSGHADAANAHNQSTGLGSIQFVPVTAKVATDLPSKPWVGEEGQQWEEAYRQGYAQGLTGGSNYRSRAGVGYSSVDEVGYDAGYFDAMTGRPSKVATKADPMDLWSVAAGEVEAERHDLELAEARYALAPTIAFLVAAENEADLTTRKALVAEHFAPLPPTVVAALHDEIDAEHQRTSKRREAMARKEAELQVRAKVAEGVASRTQAATLEAVEAETRRRQVEAAVTAAIEAGVDPETIGKESRPLASSRTANQIKVVWLAEGPLSASGFRLMEVAPDGTESPVSVAGGKWLWQSREEADAAAREYVSYDPVTLTLASKTAEVADQAKLIAVLEQAWKTNTSPVGALRQIAEVRQQWGIEPSGYDKIWEPAEIAASNSNAGVMGTLFFSLYKLCGSGRSPYYFSIGRIGDTTQYEVTPKDVQAAGQQSLLGLKTEAIAAPKPVPTTLTPEEFDSLREVQASSLTPGAGFFRPGAGLAYYSSKDGTVRHAMGFTPSFEGTAWVVLANQAGMMIARNDRGDVKIGEVERVGKVLLMPEALCKGAPFSGYADFDECLADHQDADDPSAYCGEIKRRTEDKEGSRKTADYTPVSPPITGTCSVCQGGMHVVEDQNGQFWVHDDVASDFTHSGRPLNIQGEAARKDPGYGKVYGGEQPSYVTPDGTAVWMHRKGSKVRFFDVEATQVGPEQDNVAPAAAWALEQGWLSPSLTAAGILPTIGDRTATHKVAVRCTQCSGTGKRRIVVPMTGTDRMETCDWCGGSGEEPPEDDPRVQWLRSSAVAPKVAWTIDEVQGVLTGGPTKVDGMILDAVTAQAIMNVWDRSTPEQQVKFQSLPLDRAVTIVWKMHSGGLSATARVTYIRGAAPHCQWPLCEQPSIAKVDTTMGGKPMYVCYDHVQKFLPDAHEGAAAPPANPYAPGHGNPYTFVNPPEVADPINPAVEKPQDETEEDKPKDQVVA